MIEVFSPVVIALIALVVGLGFLTAGLWLSWRDARRQIAAYADTTDALISREVTQLGERIDTLGHGGQDLGQEIRALRQDLAAIRADLDWLAGDRMIEQAIQMCRDGLPVEKVAKDCGMTADTLRTLNVLRAH